MIEFILFVTVIGVWVGAFYLHLIYNQLIEDIRDINDDVETCLNRIDSIEKSQAKKNEIKNDEFLGI
tara:strand:+ start:108 stop:308 length:201 start_codon:yes stop_codon:yes gene_type:complete